MDLSFDELPRYKRWPLAIASASLYPTLLSALGLTYFGVPERFQITIRRWIPEEVREYLLGIYSLDTWILIALIITITCAVWGGIGSHTVARIFREKYLLLNSSFESLKSEHDSKSINTYRLFSNWLYSYNTHLKLTENERISLYKLDLDMFLCIGRYSENELFNSKPARLYPKNQGGISRAWETGHFEEAEAPDPEVDMNSWVQYNVDNFNFSSEELTKIRMKSRSFYGVRLKNASNTTVAVILFESLRLDGLPFGKLSRLINDQEKSNLAALVDSLKEHTPNMESAREEGF